ncbi:Na+/H+ antiporter [Nocardiopsis metallicus]|uniref:CPA1 family monovalent cation:H+ antiporter n=1 Tax=Nocardiopsis metallicus TaxID=179819 RepID=A0A840WLJ3_9ACTN|nr:Na+/H+ antiporter [Nocardiopsis metallicus]MBB5492695.1 CPA1 family monovalent cation:H+ antiporter [Nocardiopsis metallicus]
MAVEEYVIATLVVVVAVIVGQLVAGRIRIPGAVVLVMLGMLLGVVPWMHSLSIAPEVILLVFLPPLIYNAAFFSSPKDMRDLARPIIVMSVGMTLATAFGLAAIIHLLLPDAGWPAAIALGAAIAPTDAVAASAILKRAGTPRRVLTILEGESLINDGVALTLFSLAITAMLHPLTPADAAWELGRVVVGGLVYGAVVAVVIAWARSRMPDASLQLMTVLITPFVAYIPAEMAGFSGVLAAVVAGFYLGTRGEGLLPPRVRVSGKTIWTTLVSLLEAMLFVLLGLQLDAVVRSVQEDYAFVHLVLVALAVTATAIVLRMVLMLFVVPVQRYLPGSRLDVSAFRERVAIGWSGMRGAVSLAIALSLPATLGGEEFTDRGALIFVAGAVVMGTLVGQGTSLPWLLRRLGLSDEGTRQQEFLRAEYEMDCAAVRKVDEMLTGGDVDGKTADAVRERYAKRISHVKGLLDAEEPDLGEAKEAVRNRKALLDQVTQARRDALMALYRSGEIDYDVFTRLTLDMDIRDSGSGQYGA